MGQTEEQAENELRETVTWLTLLLRQADYSQNSWQTIRVQVRVRLAATLQLQSDLRRLNRRFLATPSFVLNTCVNKVVAFGSRRRFGIRIFMTG